MKIDSNKIIDISPLIHSGLAVFPQDVTFEQKISMSTKSGDNISLSSFTTTTHIGAHTDAPIHYHKNGKSIESVAIDNYIGSCQVIEVTKSTNGRIYPEHIKSKKILAERVLFKTLSFPNPDKWNGDFTALSPELIIYLKEHNVRLVGIDTPSIDPANSKALETHNEVYKNDFSVLEGIVLNDVKEGVYTLIALPLKIKNGDASPVRAILIKD